ncbi:MAG: HAD family phosphatase [Anaerolineae bacterium]|nr:HAD family phosphatase [Anaerolineae bacterium]
MLTLTSCPEAVIFDMDGLLVDSEPVWEIVEHRLLGKRGKVLTDDIRMPLIGLRMDDFWRGLRAALEIPDAEEILIAEAVNSFVSMIPGSVPVRPGAGQIIQYLIDRRVPIAIASSSPMAVIDGVVAEHLWDAYFPVRVTGDEVPEGKPAPDIYLEAARRLGANPANCLALEDSRNGARAAAAAGMITVAVPDLSHGTPEGFASITPFVVESLHEVQAALEALACFG